MTAAQISKLRRKIRFRRAIRRWRFPLISLLIAFLAGAGYGGYWAYGKILNRQAFALVQRAMEDLQQGKVAQARMGADTALRIRPGHPAATRLMARIQAASGEPERALATFQKLTDERQLTLSDLKLYASLAAQKGEQHLAKRLADAVAANGDPSFPHILEANMLLQQKKTAEAEASFRAAVKANPSDATRALLLDFLISNRRPGQSMRDAAVIIQDFSTRDTALGAQALAIGLRTGLMNPDKRNEWIEQLRSHPKADTGQRLLAYSALNAMNPASKPQIAAEIVEFVKSRPLRDRAIAAQWLASRQEAASALSILPLEEAITKQQAFIVWLDAQAVLKDWSASLDALARPENPLPAHATKLFQGLAMKQLGKSGESQALFQEAISAAGNDPDKFAFVTLYVFNANEPALFDANLAKVRSQPDLAPSLLRNFYPSVMARRDAALNLRVLEALAVSSTLAHDPSFQNDLAHHRILLVKPVPLDFLRRHSKENPDNISSLATLAFHKLKSGDASGAMALFDSYGPDVDARSLPPRILCIYAATLAANGKSDLALKIASIIPPLSISRQEVDFLNGYLKVKK
jgi:Tfp pilus assembly protein PilF